MTVLHQDIGDTPRDLRGDTSGRGDTDLSRLRERVRHGLRDVVPAAALFPETTPDVSSGDGPHGSVVDELVPDGICRSGFGLRDRFAALASPQ